MKLYALTVWQPWANLIMAGAKPFEFRGWPAPKHYRGQRIAIHAGARKASISEIRALRIKLAGAEAATTGLRKEIALPLLEQWTLRPDLLPLGSILGTAVLGTPIRGEDLARELGLPVNDSDRWEHSNWGWPLFHPRRFEPIVPAKGAQGFWPCDLSRNDMPEI